MTRVVHLLANTSGLSLRVEQVRAGYPGAEEWVPRAELDRLREALTPSGATKAAYMGEIRDPETKRMVSWTAIKMVMAMISKRAALAALDGEDGG